jgi:rRNA maturation endonuclease Nob1
MNKVVEIVKAWGISVHPNKEQYKMAIERILVCEDCEHKVDDIIIRCDICGCPLKRKVYSPVTGACPLHKWDVIDKKYIV